MLSTLWLVKVPMVCLASWFTIFRRSSWWVWVPWMPFYLFIVHTACSRLRGSRKQVHSR